MKKYQLWLGRKSYSQHLNNLIKIQTEPVRSISRLKPVFPELSAKRTLSPIIDRVENKQEFSLAGKNGIQTGDRSGNTSRNSNSGSLQQKLNPICLNQLAYIISPKELRNRKIRLMKSFDIMKENSSILRRIKEAKPFTRLFRNSSKEAHNYGHKRAMERKNETSSEILKNNCFKQFLHLQHSHIKKTIIKPKYLLQVRLHCTARQLAPRPHLNVWLELPHDNAKSNLLSDVTEGQFEFVLEKSLPTQFTVRICYCKGLAEKIIGEYPLASLRLGGTTERVQCEKSMELSVKYEEIVRKFKRITPIK